LSYEKSSRVIGVAIDPKTVDEILTRFGLQKTGGTLLRKATARQANQSATWKIPSYRRDLQRDVDLIEEVLRAYGIDKIPGRTRGRFMPTSMADTSHDVETLLLRDRLTATGLSEVRTSKLISRSVMSFGKAVELRNPLSEDHVALRPNLISGLLDVLERNIRAGAESVSIFEIGRVFIPPAAKEERHLAILLTGNVASGPNWRSETRRTFDMLDLKGVLESVVPNLSLRAEKSADFALAVDICSGDMRIGSGGQLLANKSSASNSVVVAELDVDGLPTVGSAKKFRELDRYPAITRDIAMIVPEKLTHAEILRVIENPSEPLLESVQLFDLFEGVERTDPTASGKSLAYRLTYRAKNRTLTNEEVTAAHAKIRERLRRELEVTLRE
jgi:phenylalanyl-tRNA synthetase beta chain